MSLLTVSSSFLTKVRAEGTTVYVDPSGADGAYTRLDLAAAALPSEGGTIVIKADADTSLSSSSPTLTASGKIRIVGETSSVKLTQKRALIANCELEIDNLVYVNGAASGFDNILCQGNNVTIGSGVTTLPNGSRYINIYAGKTTGPLSGVNSNVNIHGGQWKNVYSGNNSKAFSGTVNFDFENTTIENFALSGYTGASTATINAAIKNGTSISSIQKTINTGTYTGTATVTLKGGTINSVTDVTPDIDLSQGGTLTLNQSLIVVSLIGGGRLNLGNGVDLTADSFEGELELSVAAPVSDTTYLTINDTAATGTVDYVPQTTETLDRTVGENAIEYTVGEAPVIVIPDTVYLDPAGTAGHEIYYTTMVDAMAALPAEGGTMIVCSDVAIASGSNYQMEAKPVIIEGESDDVRITLSGRSWCVNEDTVIRNVTIVSNTGNSYAFIYAQGHDLTIGPNVTTVKNSSTNRYLAIYAGKPATATTDADSTINISSGTWFKIFGANNASSRAFSGTVTINLTNIDVEEVDFAGATGASSATTTVNIGNGANVGAVKLTNGTATFTGTAALNLFGGTVGEITDVTPNIDLSLGGELTLNQSLSAGELIGGGRLNLGNGVDLTVDSFEGELDLSIVGATDGVTYLTVNDDQAGGEVNYLSVYNESLVKDVDEGIITYTISESQEQVDVTLYVDPAGTSEHENAYTSLMDAANALPNYGGTIVICSDTDTNPSKAMATFPAKPMVIVGETDSVRLTLNYAFKLSASLEINDLTFVNGTTSSYCYIYTKGNDLTIGDNVEVLPYNSTTYPFIFAGGGSSEPITADDQVITINSGYFGYLFSGGKAAYSGNLTWNVKDCEITLLCPVGSGSTGTCDADVVINIENSTFGSIHNNNTYDVLPQGTITENYLGGTIVVGTNDFNPNIDLSSGSTLTLSDDVIANDLIGGGDIVLTNGATITAETFVDEITLTVVNPVIGTTYLTVNDPTADGEVTYVPFTNEELVREVAETITYTIQAPQGQELEKVTTVYLDPAGTSEHDKFVYTTIEEAVAALDSEGGTIVVCSDAQVATSSAHYHMPAKPIRITGETADVKLIQNRSFFINEDTTIDNITWVNNSNASYAFLYCQGHSLTIGENVTCLPNGSVYLCILAGSANVTNGVGAVADGSTVVTINSGRFRRLFGGGLAAYAGSSTFNINGGYIENIYLAGSGASGTVNGTGTINITGGQVNDLSKNSGNGVFTGTAVLNITGGNLNTINDLDAAVDLSEGGTLRLRSSVALDTVVGGGTLELANNVSVTANSLTGTITLELDKVVPDQVVLTILDEETTGVVNYTPAKLEELRRSVEDGSIKYTMYEAIQGSTVQGTLQSDGTITLNIASTIDDSIDKDTAYILINNVKTNLSDLEEVNGKATIATPAMAPRQLNDSFTIRYYDGDDNPISNETTISIKDYITILLNDSNTTETGKTFYKSLLNYASYAQEYFEYNTENLANAGLEESDKDVSAVTYENVLTYAASIANETEGISAYGQSLVLKSNVILRVYFTLDGSHAISEYKFYDGEELLTARRYSGNLYYVEVANTAAPDLDKNHTVEVKLGEEGSLSVTCSALTYAEIILRDAPTNAKEVKLATLVKSLYAHAMAAKDLLGE